MALDDGVMGTAPYPQRVVVATLRFEVRDSKMTLSERCKVEYDQIQRNLTSALDAYFVDEVVSVEGVSHNCTPANGGFDTVADADGMTFRLRVADGNGDTDSFVGDKLVDTSTGQVLIRARDGSVGVEYTAELVAIDGKRNLTIASWMIAPKRRPDTFDVTNGPDGRACVNGAPIDAVEFDSQYECDCSGTDFTGDNCDVAPASQLATILGAGLGAVLCVILAVLMTTRVQLYRISRRPVDMKAVQGDVLTGLGMGVVKDILDHEFGIMLGFEHELDIVEGSVGQRRASSSLQSESELIVMVATHVPRLKKELEHARVMLSEHDPNEMLLIMPKPGGLGKTSADIPERTVSSLAKQIRRRGILPVGTTNSAVSVRLALPHCVPREMDRGLMTRLALLGAGAFGEVSLYEVNEPKRGIPPYRVAAKTVKPGGALGRDELLKEAALMGLLNHRNVLALVGVVTVPRELPALVLIMYCEGGELFEHVRKAGPDGISTAKRLTFAAQIALGMQHISSCNIVHRDLAARNVLLDSMGKCKVADFGMSASLVQADKQYAAEYVRVQEEIALRWAAPEALHDQRFSVQSDVWSFGVTVWELFAAGAVPYGDLGLAEVGAFVKGGGRLEPPVDGGLCPPQVFAEVMLPCWSHAASNRPGFDELYDAAIRNGGVEDDAMLSERAANRRISSQEHEFDRTLLAPSIHHVETALVPQVARAIRSIKQGSGGHPYQRAFDALDDPANASIWHAVHAYAKPASENTTCPRDGMMGSAYVDTLVDAAEVGRATALLSYSWGYKATEVSAALSSWAVRTDRSPTHTYIWICSLCLNQYRMADNDVEQDLQKEFGDRVVAIGRILPMLEPWDDPGYVKRAWCLFELYTAIRQAPPRRRGRHHPVANAGAGVPRRHGRRWLLGHRRCTATDQSRVGHRVGQGRPGGDPQTDPGVSGWIRDAERDGEAAAAAVVRVAGRDQSLRLQFAYFADFANKRLQAKHRRLARWSPAPDRRHQLAVFPLRRPYRQRQGQCRACRR